MSSSDGSAGALLFEDIFEVEKLNPEGKKFERVDRIVAKGETYETDLKLDIANEIFSLKAGEKFTLALASTLRLDGKPDSDYYDPDGKVRVCCVHACRAVRVFILSMLAIISPLFPHPQPLFAAVLARPIRLRHVRQGF